MGKNYGMESYENVKGYINARYICSIISTIACSSIILMYFTLLFQGTIWKKIKASYSKDKPIKKSETGTWTSSVGSWSSSSAAQSRTLSEASFAEARLKAQKISKKSSTFGIGNHAMFFLILNNLLWCSSAIFSAKYYPRGFLFELDKFTTICPLLGFFEQFFDLSAIGWTSVITNLFLNSATTKKLNAKKEREKLLRGFLLAFCLPLALAIFPFYTSSYGPAGAYCSFDAISPDKATNPWYLVLLLYTFFNIVYNVFSIIRIIKFYCQKLKGLEKQNKKDYSSMKKYISISSCFPLFLILTRGPKAISEGIQVLNQSDYVGMSLIYQVTYSLTGLFNSILCFFFFKRIFKCEKKKQMRTDSFSSVNKGAEELISKPEVDEKNEENENDEQGVVNEVYD